MWAWIMQHQLIAGVGAYFLFSNAVQALVPPDEKSSGFYRWLFVFSHGMAVNIKYALQKAAPQMVAPDQPKV